MKETKENRTRVEDLQRMFAREGIQFSREEGWEELEEHVEYHKYLLSQQLQMDVSWEDAVYSWYDNVLRPLKNVILSWEFRSAFPRQMIGDLYLGVSDHWLYLKERDPSLGAEEAAVSFVTHYGKGIARWFSRFLLPSHW
ncbi:MAG: hypothetical protein ACOC28_03745 [Alkalispirochaetaceae bacterium]